MTDEATPMPPYQSGVTGYRILTPEEVALINKIKDFGEDLGTLVAYLKHNSDVDQRWVSIGATDLQKGLMALTRAVAKPTTF